MQNFRKIADLHLVRRQLTTASGKCLDLQNILQNLLKLDVLYEVEAVLIVAAVSSLRKVAGALYDRSTKIKMGSAIECGYDYRTRND